MTGENRPDRHQEQERSDRQQPHPADGKGPNDSGRGEDPAEDEAFLRSTLHEIDEVIPMVDELLAAWMRQLIHAGPAWPWSAERGRKRDAR